MVVKFKLFKFEKVFDVTEIAGDQVIHADDMISLPYETVTEMGSQKTGRTGDKHSFSFHDFFFDRTVYPLTVARPILS